MSLVSNSTLTGPVAPLSVFGFMPWAERKICPAGSAPVAPVTPVTPVTPVGPVGPVGPVAPVAPVTPVVPFVPSDPAGPVGPVAPVAPSPPPASKADIVAHPDRSLGSEDHPRTGVVVVRILVLGCQLACHESHRFIELVADPRHRALPVLGLA